MSTESDALIELIAEQTHNLLAQHWTQIENYLDGEDKIKLAFSHTLSYQGSERTVKTTISFSHRIKDQVENSINPAQHQLPIDMDKTTIRVKHK